MFSNIIFSFPEFLKSVTTNAANDLVSTTAEINNAKARLTATPVITLVNNPIADSCSGSFAELRVLNDLLAHALDTFCVHPWTQGVGQGESNNRYLSPANAVAAVANKFSDFADINRPTLVVDACCVLLTGKSYSELATSVAQFCNVFPDSQLNLCMRRAQQLSTLEKDKVILPNAAGNAYWRPCKLAAVGKSTHGFSMTGEIVGHAAGYEAGGISADQDLLSLATKKQQYISDIKASINLFSADFSGSTGRGVFISGKTPEQIKILLSANTLGHDEPLACCVVYCGVPGSLNILRGMLGL